MVLEALIHIKNRTTFKYIEHYILSCNFIENWITWGTSIRRAWFDHSAKIHPSTHLPNIGYDKETLDLTEGFVDWFIQWMQEN